MPVFCLPPSQAVYGALNAIEGLQTFTDVMENTRVGAWYWAMKEEVTQSRGTEMKTLARDSAYDIN